ncbi:hypothetical protein VM98_34975, partial [Streptomyces rubellomurinus subsp. indigoferus]
MRLGRPAPARARVRMPGAGESGCRVEVREGEGAVVVAVDSHAVRPVDAGKVRAGGGGEVRAGAAAGLEGADPAGGPALRAGRQPQAGACARSTDSAPTATAFRVTATSVA